MEFFDAFGRDPPLGQVSPRRLGIRRLQQIFVIKRFGPGHGAEQRLFVAGPRRCALSWGGTIFEFDTCPLGQHFQRFAERNAFHLHNEAEDVAADVANPTFERLPLRIDLKARPTIVVPGAQSNIAATLASQLNVMTHEVDYVYRLADLFFRVQ